MLKKDQLTSEAIKKHFHDNFELSNFAIRVARYLVQSGHEVNISYLLREIERNPSLYTPESLELLDKADQREQEEIRENG